jgi:K+-transporting ATPase ATPase B chain
MQLRPGDRVVVEAGQVIPGDGEIIEGVASVDESAITGESAPVIRETGGDRSGVTGGTTVLSDSIVVRITAATGESFLDRMIGLVEGAIRQRTPNEIALTLVLSAFTLIFLIVVVPLWPMARNAEQYMTSYLGIQEPLNSLGTDVPTLVGLLVCLIPTTIGALLAAIGIAGMDRALQANILAKSGRAVETAGDVDTVLLDKTGTITMGARRATKFVALGAYSESQLAHLAALASVADQTPEGKSIVRLAGEVGGAAVAVVPPRTAEFIPFSAQTRMSGIDLPDGRRIRKGAPDAVAQFVRAQKGTVPERLDATVNEHASRGATPLVVADAASIAGVVVLEDILKAGIAERFARLRKMGLRTVMITGDNPLTAATIAAQAGVDDFIAESTPEAKLAYIRKEQAEGKLVAMMGDGTNDAPALAQADVGLAMNSGTQAAKEAGNMVDLDSDPTKVLEVVEIGKQLLMTRGALTTFSIANDVAKYFAIVPALFAGTLPWLAAMDVMHLHSPTSAILSAVIFNAIIIPLLIPIALRGVEYKPLGADALLRRNLLIWGLGGVIVPFIGIKLIDVVMVSMHLLA